MPYDLIRSTVKMMMNRHSPQAVAMLTFLDQQLLGVSVGHLPAIKPYPPTLPQLAPWRPPPTQWLGAVVGALKNRLLRRHALVIDNASCAWRFLTLRDSGLVGYSLDACCDNCRKW